jgi:hypothetical protein
MTPASLFYLGFGPMVRRRACRRTGRLPRTMRSLALSLRSGEEKAANMTKGLKSEVCWCKMRAILQARGFWAGSQTKVRVFQYGL